MVLPFYVGSCKAAQNMLRYMFLMVKALIEDEDPGSGIHSTLPVSTKTRIWNLISLPVLFKVQEIMLEKPNKYLIPVSVLTNWNLSSRN